MLNLVGRWPLFSKNPVWQIISEHIRTIRTCCGSNVSINIYRLYIWNCKRPLKTYALQGGGPVRLACGRYIELVHWGSQPAHTYRWYTTRYDFRVSLILRLVEPNAWNQPVLWWCVVVSQQRKYINWDHVIWSSEKQECLCVCMDSPELRFFIHFHLEMCFAPQRRALFQQRNC